MTAKKLKKRIKSIKKNPDTSCKVVFNKYEIISNEEIKEFLEADKLPKNLAKKADRLWLDLS